MEKETFLKNIHHDLHGKYPLNFAIHVCKDCTAKKKEYVKEKLADRIPKDILNLGNIDVYAGRNPIYITTPRMKCLFGFDKRTNQMCLQFTDFKTDMVMRSFYDYIERLELEQMKYIGLDENTCDLYNSQIRQDKDEKYDPYLLVKVPFKNNRYMIDICDKESSACSVTNIYNFTDMQCDIFIDKIWKFNDNYICKWKVKRILLV